MDYLGDMIFKTLHYGTAIIAIWAFIDAAIRPTTAYVAAGKLTKPAWLALTGASAFFAFWPGFLSIFQLAGLVASIVYLVDVRPAIRERQGGSHW